jgi:hypothetical protein
LIHEKKMTGFYTHPFRLQFSFFSSNSMDALLFDL